MSRTQRWSRLPIMIKEPVVIDGLRSGALRAIFPDDPDYEEQFRDFVRFQGAYPYRYATDEDIAQEHERRAERARASA